MPVDTPTLRIGAFARRVGVSAELLRAWERRYGLLRPVRSSGGYRLYGDGDAERVARMRDGLAAGLSAAEAARAAMSDGAAAGAVEGAGPPGSPASSVGAGPLGSRRGSGAAAADPEARAEAILEAIGRYDDAAVHAELDAVLAIFGLETVLAGIVLPVLAQVGRAWQEGRLDIGHEHFASNVLRGRLLAMGRLWGRGSGPLAVLACAPGDTHDLSLIAFGLLLRSYGWRILLLGASTPMETLAATAASTRPELTVVATFTGEGLEPEAALLRRLVDDGRLVLAGPAATAELSARLGVPRLEGDLLTAARRLGSLASRAGEGAQASAAVGEGA